MTHVPTLKKFMSRYGTALFMKWTLCYYKTVIYSDSVSYVFPARSSEILSWGIHIGGLAGHFGQNKTIEVVEHRFYWPNLKKDVAKIVRQCRTCPTSQVTKVDCRALHSSHLLNCLWQDVSRYFILGLSKTQKRHDSILIVVD